MPDPEAASPAMEDGRMPVAALAELRLEVAVRHPVSYVRLGQSISPILCVALLKIHIIDVAPAPAFASFGGLDDGVLCRVEVRASVAVFRGVAATYVTALHAHAEMHPGVAGL